MAETDVLKLPLRSAADLRKRLAKHWQPPEAIKLSQWAEIPGNVQFPEEHKARAGEYRNWPYMREIFDVIGDTEHERVTVMKSARLGYTKALVIAIGAVAATDPSQIMLLMPTDEDASEIGVDEVEPLFETSPALKGLLRRDRTGRNNLRNKSFLGGGSLKIRSARAPRKLRRIDIKYLFIDEADAIEVTKEGDAIAIAEKRTFAKAQRKIVKGSTPTEEGVSVVERDFEAGDGRIFEVPCPHTACGERSELVWEDIKYRCDDAGQVNDAFWQCPKCHQRVDERFKPQMIERGEWRKLRPEVTDHASFRISAVCSLLPQAAWKKLAKEWIIADRGGPATRQVFVNTILGRPWRVTLTRVDAATLMARAEPMGYPNPNAYGVTARNRPFVLPEDVVACTVGADVQDDRIEATVVGWTVNLQPIFLGHRIFEGNTLEEEVWKKFDRWHKDTSFKHDNGWRLGIDAMAVDSGGREGRTQVIYDWCAERIGRNIFAIKGDEGPNKKAWHKAKKVKGAARLYIVGVDQLKTQVLDAIGREYVNSDGVVDLSAARFSDSLEETWYEQLTNETRRLEYKDNRPVIKFKLKKQGLRNEALDCSAYAFAVKNSVAFAQIDLAARAARRKVPAEGGEEKPAPRRKLTVAEIAKRMNS